MSGYIFNYVTPGNQVVDITGKTLELLFNFVDKGASTPTDHAGSTLLPSAVQQQLGPLLNSPLSQTFDGFWSVAKDSSGQTQRDKAAAQIVTAVQREVAKLGSSYTAYNIQPNLPKTGLLRTLVLPSQPLNPNQKLLLSYWLAGCNVNFTTTSPDSGGVIPDPEFTLTFDIEVFLIFLIPTIPCTLTVRGSPSVMNANLSAGNATAKIGEAIKNIINYVTAQPLIPLFQSAEGQVDSFQPPNNLGPLTNLLNQLSAACTTAIPFGFTQFATAIDQNTLQPIFRLIHPIDASPTVFNDATVGGPTLFRPVISTNQSQVRAGGQLIVTGSNFQAPQANHIFIGWTKTASGTIQQSDIEWGPQFGAIQSVTQTTGPLLFTATNLKPNATYQFRVREQDQLTMTPWSSWFTITTQSSEQVTLWLDQNTGSRVGTVGLGSAYGGYSAPWTATITIPSTINPGQHTLNAQLEELGSPVASTTITVVGSGQNLHPMIEVLDLNSNNVLQNPGVVETYKVKVRGEGFTPGTVDLYVDNVNGKWLGQAIADQTGMFMLVIIWPRFILGNHNILAIQTLGGQTLQASTGVFGEALPS